MFRKDLVYDYPFGRWTVVLSLALSYVPVLSQILFMEYGVDVFSSFPFTYN